MKLERIGIMLVAGCLTAATVTGVAGAKGFAPSVQYAYVDPYGYYNYGVCRQGQGTYAEYDAYGGGPAMQVVQAKQTGSFYNYPPYVKNAYLGRYGSYSMIAAGAGYESYPYSWNVPCPYAEPDSSSADDTADDASDETNSEMQPDLIYEVRSGDTLYRIARSFDITVQSLMDANGIDDPRMLQIGQQVVIPGLESETDSVEIPDVPDGKQIVKVLTSTLTAYTAGYESTGKNATNPAYGITYSGSRAKEGRTIAVDPSVIPLGTTVMIEGVGIRKAEDIGSAVRGVRIDVFMDDLHEARKFGVKKDVKVYVLAGS
jgi:3D (Asp-Asp-Asp) domain-containing protein